MKKFIKISLILASLILMATATFANDFLLKTGTENQKTINIIISEAQDVNLSISSIADGVIYEQKIHTEKSLSKVYNLAAFPDGHYTVKVESETKLIEYQVTIENGKTIVSNPITTAVLKPILTKEDEVITLNMENTPVGIVELKILNEYNEELYTKTFTARAKLVKKFNVAKTDAKGLTFIIKSKNQAYTETLLIN
jgi:hypothetical protein